MVDGIDVKEPKDLSQWLFHQQAFPQSMMPGVEHGRAVETSLDALIASREQLISEIRSHLVERSKRLLLSFHELKPDWELLGTPDMLSS
jgi:hypothetical protein